MSDAGLLSPAPYVIDSPPQFAAAVVPVASKLSTLAPHLRVLGGSARVRVAVEPVDRPMSGLDLEPPITGPGYAISVRVSGASAMFEGMTFVSASSVTFAGPGIVTRALESLADGVAASAMRSRAAGVITPRSSRVIDA